MRVLMIAPFYNPNMIGGEERVLQLLSNELSASGIETGVYTIDSNKKYLETEFQNGVKIYRGTGGFFSFKNINRNGRKSIWHRLNSIVQICNLSIKKEMHKVINDFKPDIIHTHNLYGFSSIVWKYAKANKIPVIHTSHDYWLLNRSKLFFTRKNSRYVDIFTAPSKCVIDIYHGKGVFNNIKSLCVPNGIDIDKGQILLNNKDALNRLQANRNIRFIFAGQLEEIKGVTYLINAFRKLSADNAELVICGDGGLRDYVTDAAGKDSRIKYLGKLPFNKLEIEYKKSTVLVAPSVWDEPFGLIALEAYAYSLPIIAGKRGGLIEIVNNLKNGELIEPDDLNGLTEVMMKFCDKEFVRKYLYRGEADEFMYTVTSQTEIFKECYKNLLENYVKT